MLSGEEARLRSALIQVDQRQRNRRFRLRQRYCEQRVEVIAFFGMAGLLFGLLMGQRGEPATNSRKLARLRAMMLDLLKQEIYQRILRQPRQQPLAADGHHEGHSASNS
ncbi:hypothetical protein [Spongiibacter tropicus]|uniref:hypothetical protein n=1 Tax=Spongiibacter tropicus TaxID=454602 RepID=UPI0035BE50D3